MGEDGPQQTTVERFLAELDDQDRNRQDRRTGDRSTEDRRTGDRSTEDRSTARQTGGGAS
jgi:hypothetical protein